MRGRKCGTGNVPSPVTGTKIKKESPNEGTEIVKVQSL